MCVPSADLAAARLSPNLEWYEGKLSPQDYARLGVFIQSTTGIQISLDKQLMVESRLRKRLHALELSGFHEYCERVLGADGDEAERIHLIDAVTTNKTDFFREPSHFTYLTREALPLLLRERDGKAARPLTLWSAASSSGEEPYTLAMVLSEFAERQQRFPWQILGTDISTRVLATAQRAVYTEEAAAAIPPALKCKYLLRSRDHTEGLVRIVPSLRQKVDFKRLNLLDPHYDIPRPIDIIFCRNVFIYFSRATQEQILGRFVEHLRPGGLVFLGHSETMNGHSASLEHVAPTIYRKVCKIDEGRS
jgi:chemotaxis protein methyltransferase CheR